MKRFFLIAAILALSLGLYGFYYNEPVWWDGAIYAGPDAPQTITFCVEWPGEKFWCSPQHYVDGMGGMVSQMVGRTLASGNTSYAVCDRMNMAGQPTMSCIAGE